MPGALDHDESGEAPDTPDSAKPMWRPLTALLAAAIVALVVGATFLVAGDDAFDLWDSTPDTCVVENPSDALEVPAPQDVRQVLSPEPVLQWTQVASPVGASVGTKLLSSVSTPPDGLVYILATEEERTRLLVTADGIDWKELPLPIGIDPEFLQMTGEHWVIAGPATSGGDMRASPDVLFEPLEFPLDHVVVSDDGGESWIEVPVDPQNPPLWRDQHLFTLDLLASGDQIALVTLVRPVMHLDDVLADRGLLQANEDAGVVGFEDGDVVVAIRETGPLRASDIAGTLNILRLPLDDLDLTERDLELVRRLDHIDAADLGYVRVYAGDRNGLETAAEFDSGNAAGVATEDGLILAVDHKELHGSRFLASAKARTWDEIYLAGKSNSPPMTRLGVDGNALALVGDSGRPHVLVAIGCGQVPMPVAAFQLPEPNGSWRSKLVVSGGPAGLVAIQSSTEFEVSKTEATEQDGTPTEIEAVVYERREEHAFWSPDGHTWMSLDTQEAFGVDLASSSIRFAVGGDFVLASVKAREMNPVWYVAEVP